MARHLQLHDLRAFLTIVEEGSIRKAAERLHVSQPPLSRRIRSLERFFGVALLVRTTSGVAPTARGKRLVRAASRLLEDAEALVAEIGASEGAPLRAGFSLGLPTTWDRRVMRAWARLLKGRGVQGRSDYSPALAKDLRGGSLDVALVSLPGDTSGLETEILASQALVAAIPSAHPAARRRAVALPELQDLSLFWFPRSSNPHFHDWCTRVFREIGFKPRYEFVEPGFPFTLERIGQGEGFTLLNGWRTRARVPGVAYRALLDADRLSIDVALAWKAGPAGELAPRLARAARRALRD